jgi:hypothetical protein
MKSIKGKKRKIIQSTEENLYIRYHCQERNNDRFASVVQFLVGVCEQLAPVLAVLPAAQLGIVKEKTGSYGFSIPSAKGAPVCPLAHQRQGHQPCRSPSVMVVRT